MCPARRLISRSGRDSCPVPSAYVRLALDVLAGEEARVRERRLEDAGLAAGAESAWGPTLPLRDALRLLARLASDQPAGWQLRLAPRLDSATHGPLGFAAITAPDLATALEVLLRYAETRAPFLWLARTGRPEACRLECHASVGLGPLHQPLLEVCLLAILALVTQVTGREPRECSLLLPGPAMPYAAELGRLARCPVRFGADACAVELPAAWLPRPSLFADSAMHRMSLARCREALRAATATSELEASLRHELLAGEGASPGLVALARKRHVGPRTLMRRLKKSGTSYRRIRDEVRSALAAELLRHSDLPVVTISARLGFADPANFGRAFRGWYGVSPGRFRSG